MNIRLKKSTKDMIFGIALLIPAFLLLSLLFLKPTIDLITTSLTNKNLIRPDRLDFIGFENYKWLITKKEFWDVLLKSFIYTISVTSLSIIISMAIALLFNMKFKSKTFLFAILLLPWVTSYMASAFVFTLIYDYSYGMLNYLLSDILHIMKPQNWLGQTNTAMLSVCILSIWHFLPFSILVLTAALKQVPKDLVEFANIDGANKMRIFYSITIPTIKPTLITLLILRFAAVFKIFDSIYLLTSGGPGDATTTLPMWYYQIGFESFRAGKGAAIGVVLVLIVVFVYSIVIKTFGEDAV